MFADTRFFDNKLKKRTVYFLDISKCIIPKTRKLRFEQRVAVRYLRESGLSYREIGKQVCCNLPQP